MLIQSDVSDVNVNEAALVDGKLRLLSLYDDIGASGRARSVACAISRLAGPNWQITSEMWKIDTIQVSEPIRQMITNDAENADVIIIASASLTFALMQWLDTIDARNRPVTGLIVGLIGDDETTMMELSRVVEPLIHSAQKMGCDFIWHWMGEGARIDSDWLNGGVEKLLDRKLAASNEMVFC
jgi:hypothetical protein